jgi:thiol-disulfide isomerase/thioredoxin
MTTPNDSTQTSPRSPINGVIILLVIAMLGFVAAGVFIAVNGGLNRAPPTPLPVTQPVSLLLDRPAPNFELLNLDGEAVRLSNFRGRVVFLNFWATWCEPCIRELPALEAFQEAQGEDGALVLAINNGETAEQINDYFRENGFGGLLVLLDSEFEVQDSYNVNFFPTTFVVDASGTVRDMHRGEITQEDLEAYVAAMES